MSSVLFSTAFISHSFKLSQEIVEQGAFLSIFNMKIRLKIRAYALSLLFIFMEKMRCHPCESRDPVIT